MPVIATISGYYRIELVVEVSNALGVQSRKRVKRIAHVDADLDFPQWSDTEISVSVRGEADDDWHRTYFDCTVGEFFDDYEATTVGYYSTGDGVF
tara:strand:- start:170 stop:454 length:285 start_codon:yes stop_codon:yes gene_type:complete